MTPSHRTGHALMILTALTAWSALALQLHLELEQFPDVLLGLSTFFSFFTILTNLLVALATTLPLVAPSSAAGRFFRRGDVSTMAAASIVLVGLAYLLLLSHMWNPRGWTLVADVGLHYASPILFLGYWWLAVGKQHLRWRDMLVWALYPVSYFAYVMLRGTLTGRYPYYFIDPGHLGMGPVLMHASGMLLGFLAVSAGLIGIGRLQHRVAV